MRVDKLFLKDFLSYRQEYVELDEGLNVLVGKNAEGKTNLLDSIYLSSVARSSRQLKDKDLVNFDAEDWAHLKIRVVKKYSSHTVEMTIDKQGKKRVLVDGLPIARAGELMGVLNVVLFSPDEMKLVKESPDYRRRFLDISLSQQSKNYFYTLVKYNKLLVQRNKILKDASPAEKKRDMLYIVDESLAAAAAEIAAARYGFVGKLAGYADAEHKKLTGGEGLSLEYVCDSNSLSFTKEEYLKLLEQSAEKDLKLEYTTVGIHRDDLKIAAGGLDLRHFGSQGQQRSAVLALKLAELAMFRETTGETPVLLLDDVLSELDADRKKALFSAIKGVQTIVTCTEFDDGLCDEYTRFSLKNKTICGKERIICNN